MAGGIEWYRAHHGTVSDPKLGLVASKARVRRGDVIAMWHLLMEAASASEDRGNPGMPDFESIDFLLGMEEGDAERVYGVMVDKAMVIRASGRLEAWDRRQPKRERDDDNATERKRRQRARDADADNQTKPNEDTSRHVTPCHATDDDVTPREEERREEVNPASPNGDASSESGDSPTATGGKARKLAYPDCPHGEILALWEKLLPDNPRHNPALWNGKRAEALRTRWRETAKEKGWKTQDDGLRFFAKLFRFVATSPFLTGKVEPSPGRRRFFAKLEWIVAQEKWNRVLESDYHDQGYVPDEEETEEVPA
jgi:hypothetical protein